MARGRSIVFRTTNPRSHRPWCETPKAREQGERVYRSDSCGEGRWCAPVFFDCQLSHEVASINMSCIILNGFNPYICVWLQSSWSVGILCVKLDQYSTRYWRQRHTCHTRRLQYDFVKGNSCCSDVQKCPVIQWNNYHDLQICWKIEFPRGKSWPCDFGFLLDFDSDSQRQSDLNYGNTPSCSFSSWERFERHDS